MPSPVIRGVPIRLKIHGSTIVWFKVTNVQRGNVVEIRKTVGNELVASGKVIQPYITHGGGTLPYAKVSLKLVRTTRLTPGQDEVVLVDVTITNDDNDSGVLEDVDVIVDDIDGFNNRKEKSKPKRSKVASKGQSKTVVKKLDKKPVKASIPKKKPAAKKSPKKKK